MLVMLFGLFWMALGAHGFFNAKTIVPPSRDPEWWKVTRFMSPFFFAGGLVCFLWGIHLIYRSFTSG